MICKSQVKHIYKRNELAYKNVIISKRSMKCNAFKSPQQPASQLSVTGALRIELYILEYSHLGLSLCTLQHVQHIFLLNQSPTQKLCGKAYNALPLASKDLDNFHNELVLLLFRAVVILVELDLNKPNPNGVLAGWLYLECSSFYQMVAIHACFFQRQASHSRYKGYRRQSLLSQVPHQRFDSTPARERWLISFS